VAIGVSLLSALKCRGAGDTWVGAPVSLCPPAICDGCQGAEFVGSVVLPTVHFSSTTAAPPTPPPRLFAALNV
jgi:hypothetical protein